MVFVKNNTPFYSNNGSKDSFQMHFYKQLSKLGINYLFLNRFLGGQYRPKYPGYNYFQILHLLKYHVHADHEKYCFGEDKKWARVGVLYGVILLWMCWNDV